ncbi:hypothetical protein BSNK01_30620 [Bacillaceae bacterium]
MLEGRSSSGTTRSVFGDVSAGGLAGFAGEAPCFSHDASRFTGEASGGGGIVSDGRLTVGSGKGSGA